MKNKTDLFYISNILESINLVNNYLENITEEEFYYNIEKQDAVSKRLEEIGENINKTSTATKEKYDEVPWQKIMSLRNLLVHDYGGTDYIRIWQIYQSELPKLKNQMVEIIGFLENEYEKSA